MNKSLLQSTTANHSLGGKKNPTTANNQKPLYRGKNLQKRQRLVKVTTKIQNLVKQGHETKGLEILSKTRAWSWFSDKTRRSGTDKGRRRPDIDTVTGNRWRQSGWGRQSALLALEMSFLHFKTSFCIK